jgi:hypothetical protein
MVGGYWLCNDDKYIHIILSVFAAILFLILSQLSVNGNTGDEYMLVTDSALGYFFILMAIISGVTIALYIAENIYRGDKDE